MRTSIAVYFDLENIDKKFCLKKLLETITKNIEDGSTPVFAIKLACGATNHIANFREQLKNLNFEIRETPHITKKKNRADLILSVEAFESLYQKSPDIDLYVFITSDTDFTVIMDKLRKYGKNVWLVIKEEDKDKDIFTSSSDKIFVIENCFENPVVIENSNAQIEKKQIDSTVSSKDSEAMEEKNSDLGKTIKKCQNEKEEKPDVKSKNVRCELEKIPLPDRPKTIGDLKDFVKSNFNPQNIDDLIKSVIRSLKAKDMIESIKQKDIKDDKKITWKK